MPVTIDGNGVVTAGGTSTSQGQVVLGEDTDNGSNTVTIQAPASLAANRTVTMPDADINFATGLGTSQGGTGLTSFTTNGAVYATSTSALTTGTLPVASGGTGAATLTANNVLLGNGTSALQVVAPGTNGNVLTSNGTTWASTASSSGWVYLSQSTASSSATVSLETTFDSTYASYVVIGSNILVANDNASLGARLKIGGTYVSTLYKWHSIGPTSAATTYVGYNSSSDSAMYMLNDLENNSGFVNEFILYINEPTNSTNYKCIWGSGISWDQGNSQLQNQQFAGSYFGGTGVMTGIQFLCSAGNIASGTFRLYGIKKS